MAESPRQSTGLAGLDDLLGGGLVPGCLAVVVGATGIGKTQLGVQYADAGRRQEGRRGVVLDMNARGDSQNHQAYARRIAGWLLQPADEDRLAEADDFFSPPRAPGEYLHIFRYQGQRVTRDDVDFQQWQTWQAELNARLRSGIGFLYGNLVRGLRRVVVDGIEPVQQSGQSIQLTLFEYVYHQILRKDPAWVARDLFREHYRQQAEAVARHLYDPAQVGCLLLYTAQEVMLEDMISRPLDQGDLLSVANTVVYMGKIREGRSIQRALYVAKHRGSACGERIVPFSIDDAGLRLD